MHVSARAGVLVGAVVFAASASAQEAPARLAPIVVSGGLTPIPADDYGRAHSIVTAEEIERRQIVYLADALRALPGVSVNRTGSQGGLTQVRLRGAEGNHTLVIIDGIEAGDPAQGEYVFGGLLAADVARIEVLRGPQSALYGANALGGVISITTKTASKRGVLTSGSVEAGTDETVAGQAALRFRGDVTALSLSVAAQDVGGYDVSDSPGGKDDGDRNLTLNGKGELFATEWLTFGATLRHTTRESDFDGSLFAAPDRDALVFDEDDVHERDETFASFYGNIDSLGGRLAHLAQVSYLHADDRNRTNGAKTSDTTGTRLSFAWRSTLALDAPTLEQSDHRLTLAVEHERETFENNVARLVSDLSQLDTQKRNLTGLVGEYRGTLFDGFDLQLGLRHDFNDAFEDATTYSAAVSYNLLRDTRLHASVGTGVQNPTFFEQFGFIPGQFDGNPDLKPEKSFGWDVGVEQMFWQGRAIVDVAYFEQDLKDEIATLFPPPTFIGTPVNADGTSHRRGVEIAATVRPTADIDFGLTYTYLDAEEANGATEVRRPKHEGGVSATWRFLPGASASADARYVAGAKDLDFRAPFVSGQRVTLDDYVLVDVAASYQVTDGVEVYGRVNNLLDEDYEEVFGYDAPGLVAFLGLRARW